MSHKLQPSDLTSILLAPGAGTFVWGESSDRVLRYDRFVDEISAMFAVVKWDDDPVVAAQCQTDLFYLASAAQLRELINNVKDVKPNLLFNELAKCVREKIRSENPPLLQLAKLLSSQQGQGESFETYYNRVVENSKAIKWDMFDSSNFEKAIIATTFASGCGNPYVKGHCMSVRDLSSLKLEDMKTTAKEYERKNPFVACFPPIGPQKSLFGPTFGSSEPKVVSFGGNDPVEGLMTTGTTGSFEENRAQTKPSLFGGLASSTTATASLFGSGFGSSKSKFPVRKSPMDLHNGIVISNQASASGSLFGNANSSENTSKKTSRKMQTDTPSQTKCSLFGGLASPTSAAGSLFGGFGGSNKNSGNIFMKSGTTATDEQASSSSAANTSDTMDDHGSKRPRTDAEREPEGHVTNNSSNN